MNLVFVNSHPIQYYAPLYAEITKEKDITLKIVYLSDKTVKGYKDSEFGVEIKWDLQLLSGYDYVFLKNYSKSTEANKGFFSLINFGLVSFFKRLPTKSIIVVHGWSTFSNLLAIYSARIFGHFVCLRGETPLSQEFFKSKIKRTLRSIFLKFLLFPVINRFLYIGEQNRKFYRHYGVKDSHLIFTPYSVDNARFNQEYLKKINNRHSLRKNLGIQESQTVILFSAKYIAKKRPMDLIKAFAQLDTKKYFLVMMGEGKLRGEMERYISENNLTGSVLLTGFVNQTEVSNYYTVADVLVMCSGTGETWGLSVNEAMNFHLPLIISDIVGCGDDLVKPGVNGHLFKTGDIEDLRDKIREFSSMNDDERKSMGGKSAQLISMYSFEKIIEGIRTIQGEFA